MIRMHSTTFPASEAAERTQIGGLSVVMVTGGVSCSCGIGGGLQIPRGIAFLRGFNVRVQ